MIIGFAMSLILRQGRYLYPHRPVGGGVVDDLHRMLLRANLQASIPKENGICGRLRFVVNSSSLEGGPSSIFGPKDSTIQSSSRESEDKKQQAHRQGWADLEKVISKVMISSDPSKLTYWSNSHGLESIHVNVSRQLAIDGVIVLDRFGNAAA